MAGPARAERGCPRQRQARVKQGCGAEPVEVGVGCDVKLAMVAAESTQIAVEPFVVVEVLNRGDDGAQEAAAAARYSSYAWWTNPYTSGPNRARMSYVLGTGPASPGPREAVQHGCLHHGVQLGREPVQRGGQLGVLDPEQHLLLGGRHDGRDGRGTALKLCPISSRAWSSISAPPSGNKPAAHLSSPAR